MWVCVEEVPELVEHVSGSRVVVEDAPRESLGGWRMRQQRVEDASGSMERRGMRMGRGVSSSPGYLSELKEGER